MDTRQEIRLLNYIEERIGTPFSWGVIDCNVFALEATDAAYRTDFASLIRGEYGTEEEAIAFRSSCPWDSFQGLLENQGFIQGRPGFEQRGDLLVVQGKRWEMAHIYLGLRIVTAWPGEGVNYGLMKDLKAKLYSVWRYECPVR